MSLAQQKPADRLGLESGVLDQEPQPGMIQQFSANPFSWDFYMRQGTEQSTITSVATTDHYKASSFVMGSYRCKVTIFNLRKALALSTLSLPKQMGG